MISLLKGVYLLFFHITQECSVDVGKLGKHTFRSGDYVYVGSGMGGVLPRVRRHIVGAESKRWHIDYLLEKSVDRQCIIFATDDKGMECMLSRKVCNTKGSKIVVRGFGSSDCSCTSHLYLLTNGKSEVTSTLLPKCKKSAIMQCGDPGLSDQSCINWTIIK